MRRNFAFCDLERDSTAEMTVAVSSSGMRAIVGSDQRLACEGVMMHQLLWKRKLKSGRRGSGGRNREPIVDCDCRGQGPPRRQRVDNTPVPLGLLHTHSRHEYIDRNPTRLLLAYLLVLLVGTRRSRCTVPSSPLVSSNLL